MGTTGIWSHELHTHADRGEVAAALTELEGLGYSSIFLPDELDGGVLDVAEELLAAPSGLAVATVALNVWRHDADAVAARHAVLAARHPGRFLLGLGVSHPLIVDAEVPGTYRRPVTRMGAFLDALDAASVPVAPRQRLLAALGDRMLALASERTAGAHPYLVTPEYTARARALMGPSALLAPEQKVILETDPERARDLARRRIAFYFTLPNYVESLRRMGFDDDDLRDGGSDRLVDGLVAWGDEEAIADRVAEHLRAGADHVAIQVVGHGEAGLPLTAWRRLAPALLEHASG